MNVGSSGSACSAGISGDFHMAQAVVADLLDFLRRLDPSNAEDPMLTADVDLIDGGYIDSFGMVELIEFVRSRYGVDLSGADFYEGQMRKVSGIAAAIAAQPGR
jgi:acyl carrier protein